MERQAPRRTSPEFGRLLLLRFGAGLVAEGSDLLMDRLERWDDALLTAPDPLRPTPRWRATALGAAVRVPQQLREVRRRVTRELKRRFEAPEVIWLMRRRPLRDLRRRVEKVQRRVHAELLLWERLGRFEEARGRALARNAIEQVSEALVHRVAASPEMQQVIREQSTGLAHALMEQARASGVHADERVESVVRRILRRDPNA